MNQRFFLSVLTALLMMGAHAEEGKIYKWVGPDGETVFSSQPPPGTAVGVEVMDMPEPAQVIEGGKDVDKIQQQAVETSKALDERFERRKALNQALSVAREALEKALQAQEAGIEPQAGETQRILTGRVRKTPAYDERQRALAEAVREAESEVQRLADELRALGR